MNIKMKSFFDRFFNIESVPSSIMVVLLALIPTFFIPTQFVTQSLSKTALVFVAVAVAVAFYIIQSIRSSDLRVPKSPVVLAVGLLVLVYLVSSFLSDSVKSSFFGYGFEPSTFFGILIASVLTYLVAVYFSGESNDSKKFNLHTVFFFVAAVLAVLQAIFVFFGNNVLSFMSSWTFITYVANTVGKTSEFGIFFAAVAVMTVVALENLKFGKLYKISGYVLVALSLFFISIINLSIVWYSLAAIVWLLFVYQTFYVNMRQGKIVVASDSASSKSPKGKTIFQKFAVVALVVAIVATFFATPVGSRASAKLAEVFAVSNFEVRPSWEATYGIFKNTVTNHSFFGAGPNRFFSQWQLYRPDISQTPFWNVNFDSGIGFIPTSMVETGLVGVFAWMVLGLAILYVMIRSLLVTSSNQIARYFVISSAMTSAFLWVMVAIYPVGPALFALTFFFTGLLVASAVNVGVGQVGNFSWLPKSKLKFISLFFAGVLVLGLLWIIYIVFSNVAAAYYFRKGDFVFSSTGDVAKTQDMFNKALSLSKRDIFYRSVANINLLKINNLLSAAAGKSDVTEQEKNEFSDALTRSVTSAQSAIVLDPKNYENHTVLGRVYGSVVPVQIEGAYEGAIAQYKEAARLSPRNPALYLEIAKVELSKGDIKAAQREIENALKIKPDYIDAYFMQAQIDVTGGNLQSAIRSVEQIALITPSDPLVHFRLGVLYYESKNYRKAVEALEKSISLVPVYANAKYFLGLSLDKLGRTNEAIKHFEEIDATNPGNTEIGQILTNLRAGLDPFEGSEEAVSPEDREELPIEE